MNDLVVKKSELLEPSKFANEAALQATASDSQYLAYIQLMYATSNLVTDGKQSLGDFVLMEGQADMSLTKSFDCVCLSWRPRAMSYGEGTVSIFNPESPEFLTIRDRALNRVRNNAFGKEFLLYLPDYDRLALYFFGNLSGRNEAPNMTAILDEQNAGDAYILVNVSSQIVGKKDRYPVPVVKKSESVLSRFVDDDRLRAALNIFNNPKDTEIESVDEDTRDR